MSNPRHTSAYLRRDATDHWRYEILKAELERALMLYPAVEDQGTILWRIQRALHKEPAAEVGAKPKIFYAVGGSELGVVQGVDKKFTDELGLLHRKAHFLTKGCDPPSDDSPTMTAWGHMVEPLLAIFCGHHFGCDHFPLEASVVHRTVKNFRYSPDGFVILRFSDKDAEGNKIIPVSGSGTASGLPEGVSIDDEWDDLVVAVLELKNPFGRVVKGDKIPAHYLPQMLSGMDTFSEFASHGLFVEANFYVQSIGDYGKPRYNPRISGTYAPASVNGKVGDHRYDGITCIDSALIGLYPTATAPMDVIDEIRRKFVDGGLWNAKYGVYDVGRADRTTFDLLMFLKASGFLKTRESDFLVAHGCGISEAIVQLRAMSPGADPDSQEPLFVLPVGMFKCCWYLHQGNPNYVESNRGIIERFVAKLERKVEEDGGLHEMFFGGKPPAPDDEASSRALEDLNKRMGGIRLAAAEKARYAVPFD